MAKPNEDSNVPVNIALMKAKGAIEAVVYTATIPTNATKIGDQSQVKDGLRLIISRV